MRLIEVRKIYTSIAKQNGLFIYKTIIQLKIFKHWLTIFKFTKIERSTKN